MTPCRRYLIELFACIGAYAAAVALSIVLLVNVTGFSGPIATVVALLPMGPATAICWVVLRQLGRMDELHRRIQLEALGFAFAGTAVATFSYGFLETVGFPRLPMFTVWPVMGVLWLTGVWLANRRYR